MSRNPIRVLTYGTFDVLHRGHIKLLSRARALGDHLTVAVSTDRFNNVKGKKSVFPYRERRLLLSNLRCVDRVIPERSWNQKLKDVKKYKIDVFVIGDDWRGRFDFLAPYCKVVYLKRTAGVSTTQIKRRMKGVKKL